MTRKLALALAVSLLAHSYVLSMRPARAESIQAWNDPCQRLLKQYNLRSGHKAFAVTVNSAGNGLSQYCGAAWGVGSKQKAEAQAISSCKTQKVGKDWSSPLASVRCTILRSE